MFISKTLAKHQKAQSLLKLHKSFINLPALFTFSTTETAAPSNLKPGEPKWMRFFKPSEPMKVDIERAVKCDNQELLHNYVRANYLTFDFAQLVMVLDPLKYTLTAPSLVSEIKLRILAGKQVSKPNLIITLFKGAKEFAVKDKFLKRFIILELDKYFTQYNHDQQTEVLIFMFQMNLIKTENILHYMSFYGELRTEEQINQYVESLSLENSFNQIHLFKLLWDTLQPESFEKLVSRPILDALINKV